MNVDKNPAYPIAFEAIKHEGFFRPRSSLRQCTYLNNVIEQDQRCINRRTRPMLGFKRFTTAWRTVRGIEIMHVLRKGQARWMAKGDVVGQTRLIHKVFGLAVSRGPPNGLSRVIPNVATEPHKAHFINYLQKCIGGGTIRLCSILYSVLIDTNTSIYK